MNACECPWSYPVRNCQTIKTSTVSDEKTLVAVDALKRFLTVGGFVYFNADGAVVGVNTVEYVDEGEGDIDFAVRSMEACFNYSQHNASNL